MTMQTSL